MDYLKLATSINAQYHASMSRGRTEAYLEGAQVARLGLSHELNPHAECSPACMDWRRGYFTELGKGQR